MLFIDHTVFSQDVNFIFLNKESNMFTNLHNLKSVKNFHRFSQFVRVLNSNESTIEFLSNNKDFTLITCDKNTAAIVKAMGLKSELTRADSVTKYIEIDDVNALYRKKSIPLKLPLSQNEYFIGSGALCVYLDECVCLVEPSDVMGIKGKNKEQHFAIDALLDTDIDLVFLTGPAGTGKTLLSIASGMEQVLNRGIYKNMIVTRPNVSLGMDIGYLPGSVDEKMGPWLMPIEDNINTILSYSRMDDFNTLKSKGLIELQPLSFIRGRSLDSSFVVIDEAQNLTEHELKTILTRAGKGTKMVLTGDPEQMDIQHSGLLSCIESIKGHDIVASISLIKSERSDLAELAARVL